MQGQGGAVCRRHSSRPLKPTQLSPAFSLQSTSSSKLIHSQQYEGNCPPAGRPVRQPDWSQGESCFSFFQPAQLFQQTNPPFAITLPTVLNQPYWHICGYQSFLCPKLILALLIDFSNHHDSLLRAMSNDNDNSKSIYGGS